MPGVLEQADLFVHINRPSWGLAIHTQTRPNKVDFLFQDGTARTFASNYMHLIEAADKPLDVTARVVRRLRERADGNVRTPSISNAANVPSLSDQVRLFHHLFPGGFEDPAYVAKHRGTPGGRRRKALHGLAAADAQEKLTVETLRALLQAGDSQAVVDLACDVMAGTSLAPRADVTLLRKRGAVTGMADQLHSLLFNDGTCMFDRFTRWVMVLERALGHGPSWSTATVLPALLMPTEHVAVKRTVFQREANWMAPSLVLSKVPNAEFYRRVRSMSGELSVALTEAGLAPRDLLDVTAFIRIVMRPKHLELLEELPATN